MKFTTISAATIAALAGSTLAASSEAAGGPEETCKGITNTQLYSRCVNVK